MENNTPYLTIVMPVRNEERFIANTLQQLIDQDYPEGKFEIIVADGNSTDDTWNVVRQMQNAHSEIKLMSNPGELPSSGRNVGFKNGQGDYFIVIDGHCEIPNRKLFRLMAEAFLKSGADCLGRTQPFIVPEDDSWQRAIALARTSKIGHSSNSYIHAQEEGFVSPVSMGCAYSRKVFEKIGYVDESFDACEDVEFNYRVERAGFKTFFTPGIAVNYFPRNDLKGLWHQLMRYGKGRAKFIYKHPRTINIDMLIPIAFALGLMLGPIAGLLYPPFLYFYLLTVIIYMLIISFESVRISLIHKSLLPWRLIPVFFMIHFTLGFGEIIQFVKFIFCKESSTKQKS